MVQLTLRADESVRAGIFRLADAMIDNAIRCAREPDSAPEEVVHFFRTTTKRLRALLQLIRLEIGRTAYVRESARLKKIASRLASSRDRAVAAKTMEALETPELDRPKAVGRRRCERKSILDAGVAETERDQSAIKRAVNDFERARISFHRLRIAQEGWTIIGPGLTRVYRQARKRMLRAFSHPSDQAFHRWRICVKYLFYELEWLEPVWPKRFAAMHKRLHELEEKLGADHDLVVVRKMLERGAEEAASFRAGHGVKKAAKKESGRLRKFCQTIGIHIFRQKPEKFCRKCRRRWNAWRK